MTRSSTANAEHPLQPPPVAAPACMALFLDLDGTLLDLASRPDAVRVPADLRTLLSTLHERLHGALAILSGRALQDIDALLDLPNLVASGIHGVQWRDGACGGKMLVSVPTALRSRAAHLLSKYSGVLLEDKGAALALHYRGNPAAAAAIEAIAAELALIAGPNFELQRGDRVVEIKPRGADKGLALARIMRLPAFRDRQPWMFGDDHTDEHAFAEANARDGVSVLVGNRRATQAHYVLPAPVAVRAWLAQLAQFDCGEVR